MPGRLFDKCGNWCCLVDACNEWDDLCCLVYKYPMKEVIGVSYLINEVIDDAL